MNTIHSIFNSNEILHTVIGGTSPLPIKSIPITVVVLNRGRKYDRVGFFSNLLDLGFYSIISVEQTNKFYEVEELSRKFPTVKFIISQENLKPGEMVALGIKESHSEKVLVVWNDIHISKNIISETLINSFLSSNHVVLVPTLLNSRLDSLPVVRKPTINDGAFSVEPSMNVFGGSFSLYPVDFVGLYNRDIFFELGGFDLSISDSFWQLMDFGFRTWAYNKKIFVSFPFKLNYENEIPMEKIERDTNYSVFFLKNLAPVMNKEKHEFLLPMKKIFSFIKNGGFSFFKSIKIFFEVKKMIAKYSKNYIYSGTEIVESWEILAR